MLPKDVRVRERRQPGKCTPPEGKKPKKIKISIVSPSRLRCQPPRCLPGHSEIHQEFQMTVK